MTKTEFVQKAAISMASKVIGTDGTTNRGDWENVVAEAEALAEELEEQCYGFDDEEYHDPDPEEDIPGDEEVNRESVTFRQMPDGTTEYEATVDTSEEMERGGTQLMHDLAKVYSDLRKQHPEITEVTFYTDKDLRVKNKE